MKILWVTSSGAMARPGGSPPRLASVRLRMLLPMQALTARGHEVTALAVDGQPADAAGTRFDAFDVIVFRKTLSPNLAVTEAMDRAVSAGVPTLFDICDLRLDDASDVGRQNLGLLRAADRAVANTPEMANALRAFGVREVSTVTDPYEGPRREPAWCPQRGRLKVLWFGHQSNLDTLQGLLSELVVVGRDWPIQLTLVTGPKPELPGLCKEFNQKWRHVLTTRYEEWSLQGLWSALAATDVVVIPSLVDALDKLVKSPNRVVESLWAGRCVVANPLPAYMPFADWAFIADRIGAGLEHALSGQDHIVDRIRAAQVYIEQHHSPAAVAVQWERAIAEVVEARRSGRAAAAPGPSQVGAPRRLNLGCGDKLLPGYINVDVAESRAGKKPDVLCDLRELTPFESGSVDEILSVHVIEHFWRWEALDVLREWVRVLRPGGKLILECPNLLSACEALLANPDAASGPGREGQRTMWVLYGDPAWRDPLMVHRWGYTPKSLAQLMTEAGLANVRQEPAQFKLREPRDMRLVGEKPM